MPTRSLEDFTDFSVAHDSNLMMGVLGLSSSGFGHTIANEYLSEMMINYYNKYWKSIGPELFTKVLKRLCKVDNVSCIFV